MSQGGRGFCHFPRGLNGLAIYGLLPGRPSFQEKEKLSKGFTFKNFFTNSISNPGSLHNYYHTLNKFTSCKKKVKKRRV